MTRERIPVIIDTDPGVDDALAILLALASPELEIKAITLTFGNTDVERSHENVLKIFHALHKHFESHPEDRSRFPIFAPEYPGDIPFLACGSTGPLDGEPYFAKYFHGRDGLADISTRHPELSIPQDWQPTLLRLTDRSAVDVSLDLIYSHPPLSITYIALGPLTNLSRMIRKDATCVRDRLGQVVAMGGALEAPGNVTPVAEFNFYADPFAVRDLLHAQEPTKRLRLDRFVMLPLDVTTRHHLPFKDYQKLVDPAFADSNSPSAPEMKSPLAHFTTSILEKTAEVMRGFGVDALELHDPVTVWYAIHHPPFSVEGYNDHHSCHGWVKRKRAFQVERSGELTRGMLVVDRRQDKGNYGLGDNRVQVHARKSAMLNPPAVQVESEAQIQTAAMTETEGVTVVTDTPGPHELLRLMLERIWGCTKGDL